jgi:hypothetical protein
MGNHDPYSDPRARGGLRRERLVGMTNRMRGRAKSPAGVHSRGGRYDTRDQRGESFDGGLQMIGWATRARS